MEITFEIHRNGAIAFAILTITDSPADYSYIPEKAWEVLIRCAFLVSEGDIFLPTKSICSFGVTGQ